MAGVVICDRCNRFGKGEALGGLAFKQRLSDKDKSEQLEICPACVAEFIDWRDTPPQRAESGPFVAPYTEPDDQAPDEPEPKRLTASH